MYSSNRGSEWTLPFMAWELRLYLDTHPNDEKALNAYRQICAKLESCSGACRTPAGEMTDGDSRRWTWIDDPWPWQTEANLADVTGKNESEG